ERRQPQRVPTSAYGRRGGPGHSTRAGVNKGAECPLVGGTVCTEPGNLPGEIEDRHHHRHWTLGRGGDRLCGSDRLCRPGGPPPHTTDFRHHGTSGTDSGRSVVRSGPYVALRCG